MKNSLRKWPSTWGSSVLQEIFKRFVWNSLHYPVSDYNLSSTIFNLPFEKEFYVSFDIWFRFTLTRLYLIPGILMKLFCCSVCFNMFYCEMNWAYDDINELTWKRSTHALFRMKVMSNPHSLWMRKIVVSLLLCNLRVKILHALVWTFRVITYGLACLTCLHLSVNDIFTEKLATNDLRSLA